MWPLPLPLFSTSQQPQHHQSWQPSQNCSECEGAVGDVWPAEQVEGRWLGLPVPLTSAPASVPDGGKRCLRLCAHCGQAPSCLHSLAARSEHYCQPVWPGLRHRPASRQPAPKVCEQAWQRQRSGPSLSRLPPRQPPWLLPGAWGPAGRPWRGQCLELGLGKGVVRSLVWVAVAAASPPGALHRCDRRVQGQAEHREGAWGTDTAAPGLRPSGPWSCCHGREAGRGWP
mmetsp:Transcript_40114/g.115760  ORF Transcript_40114/g.115760 Transcript_40114/m.115760 type:complete len:228 (+) Transcript_40114:1161-1844(+)